MSADTTAPQALPLMPLDSLVIVPGMVVNVVIDSPEAAGAIDAAGGDGGQFVLVPKTETRYGRIGTTAKVEHVEELDDGRRAAVIRGIARVAIGAGVTGEDAGLRVTTSPVLEIPGDPDRVRALATEYRAVVDGLLSLQGGRRAVAALSGITDPSQLADTAVYSPALTMEQRVEVLETLDVQERLEKALRWAREALVEAEVSEQIRSEVTDKMDKTQREYVLRQQLAAIKRELGDDTDDDAAERYRTQLADADERGDGVPTDVREQIEKEIDRFERTSEQSPEHGWIQTWLDWMTELPWGVRDADRLDLDQAREILDADHTGLDEVKDRLIEHLAVRKLRAERGLDDAPDDGGSRGKQGSGAILTLVGPPGVGKTSLGQSVAHALGRKFVRIALGGVHDEAQIRGHRRTYVGAQPGRIARAMRDAGTMNPVIVLDEIDKVGADWRGDPSAALLEVLDPAQNHTFTDHYLEAELDLSGVLFIATGNVIDTIPPALLDRMEVTVLDGYTDAEKAAIARTHLLPAQLEVHGLTPDEVTVDDAALARVIAEYTREAGVRGLQRQLAKLVRKTATRMASASDGTAPQRHNRDNENLPRKLGSIHTSGDTAATIAIDVEAVRDLLGRRRVWQEDAMEATVPGVATGLAVTGAGGEVLFVEASASEGETGLTLTGQLGEVMRESASIALSHLRAHFAALGVPEARFDRAFHVHVPAGATPKDGPSAGVALTVALASLLSGRPVRPGLGMTGEVTLSGRVLPVGGVKAKVLAAHRAGLREVLLPERNSGDLDELPETVRDDLTVHLVGDVCTALDLALVEPQAHATAA